MTALAKGDTAFRMLQETPINQLKALKGGLTFRGFSLGHSPAPVRFGGLDAELSAEHLEPQYDPRIADVTPRMTFRASETELHAMLDSIATVPALRDESPDKRPFLSFVLANTSNGKITRFEKVMNAANTRLLLERMRSALQANAAAERVLVELACGFGMLSTATPVEATSQCTITCDDDPHADRTREQVTRVKLTNTSHRAIQGPVYLIISLTGPGVRLVNASGTTCQPLRMGSPAVLIGTPYIRLPVAEALPPNGAVEVLLNFHIDDNQPVRLAARVFAGPGDL